MRDYNWQQFPLVHNKTSLSIPLVPLMKINHIVDDVALSSEMCFDAGEYILDGKHVRCEIDINGILEN